MVSSDMPDDSEIPYDVYSGGVCVSTMQELVCSSVLNSHLFIIERVDSEFLRQGAQSKR